MMGARSYLEWQVPAHHGEEDHAAAPDVDVEALVALAGDHLRGGVAGRPASRFQGFARLVRVAQAKVDELDALVLVKQQVLGLQVPKHSQASANLWTM